MEVRSSVFSEEEETKKERQNFEEAYFEVIPELLKVSIYCFKSLKKIQSNNTRKLI